ncbi:MAG: hypothetical protein ACMXYL_01895 [Candidatus Woesearchaeota archaeon]
MVFPLQGEFMSTLEHTLPLAGYVAAIVVFALFIFSFYRFFAKRNMFELNLTQYITSKHPFLSSLYHILLYLLEYAIIFPIITFGWFLLISLSIGIVSEGTDPSTIFFVAIAIAGAVRMCSYYSEQLSQELAKTLPLALLGIFLVQGDLTSYTGSLDIIRELPSHASVLLYYFVFVILLEFTIRITHAIRYAILKKDGFLKRRHLEDFDDTH